MCCPLTHDRVILLFFFKRDIITGISLPVMLENNAHPQVNKNVMLQLDGEPACFALTVRECLNVNFPDPEIQIRGPLALPFVLLKLRLWTLFFVKDQVYS
jgi:hypothetical protein